jgi:NADH dehydrogenase FAD-containing subunit
LVQGRLTDIDRKNRAVIVSDEVIVEYDVLVLASGVQGEKFCFL